MTSPNESVEIVEVTWKIPNFGRICPTSPSFNVADFHKVVFIGGKLPPAYPQSKSPPVKLEVSFYKGKFKTHVESTVSWLATVAVHQWRFKCVTVPDESQPPSPCTFRGKVLEFKTFDSERKLGVASGTKVSGHGGSVDLSVPNNGTILFDAVDAEKYLDKRDGSLNIYFKMEITCRAPEPSGGMEFTEMSSGFESLLKNPTHSDVEIKVSLGEGRRTFQCHKVILAGRSEVFRAMFGSDMKESKANVVEVEDILPKTMEHFLSFVYCGRFQDSSWIGSLPELVYASDKYCVNSLKNICDLNLILSVKPQNAMSLGILAERHGLTKAAKDIRKYIAENVYAVTLEPNSDTSSGDANFNVRYSVPFQE